MPEEPEAPTADLSTDGSTPVAYPGPSFRPIPGFTFDMPPGWLVDESADALCFIGTPAAFDGPWSNVFLQHERVLPTAALEEIAVETWDHTLIDFPDAVAVDERLIEFEQYHYVRECELTLVDEHVTRVDSYWFGPDVDHPTVDLFHLIGLHPIEAGEDRTLEYLKMLSSFRFATERTSPRVAASADVASASAADPALRRRRRALVGRPHST